MFSRNVGIYLTIDKTSHLKKLNLNTPVYELRLALIKPPKEHVAPSVFEDGKRAEEIVLLRM